MRNEVVHNNSEYIAGTLAEQEPTSLSIGVTAVQGVSRLNTSHSTVRRMR